MFFVLVDTGLH